MNKQKANFFMMENISKFLEACTNYGLQKADQFHTAALFERTNMTQVVYTLHALGRAVSGLILSTVCTIASDLSPLFD